MSAAPQRMSRVDTAWLRMDSDVNLMLIVGIWLLRPALRYEALCERLRTALLRHPRFRRKVVEDALGYAWADDGHFDIERHVSRERLAVKGLRSEREALQARAAELASEPLDRAHPLWHWHLIEDYDGGSACIIRIHHCIGDGIALMRVLLSITDGGEAAPQRKRLQAHGHDGGDWLAEAVVRPLTRATVKAIGIYGDGLARSIDLLADPARPLAGSLDLARLGLQVAHDAAALAMMDDDSPTRLKGEPAGIKRLAWCEPLPLADVKAVARAMHCTVNDVLLACVAGAIGGYLRSVGDDPAGKQIRAMVPVNLRPPQQAQDLGNGFGLVPLVADRHRAPDRAALRGARAHERAQGQLPAAARVHAAGGLRAARQARAGPHVEPVRAQDHSGHDQRARAAREAAFLRLDSRADAVLGAAVGPHRRGRVDPELRRRRAVRPGHRQAAVSRSAAHHRPLRARIRQAALGHDDAALGRAARRGAVAGLA
jgi:WS/DGAT/MGAT family acyltransferase